MDEVKLDDIRKIRQKEAPKPLGLILLVLWKFLIRNKWKILLIITITLILFFPSWSGQALGTWITNFVGNLIHNINL